MEAWENVPEFYEEDVWEAALGPLTFMSTFPEKSFLILQAVLHVSHSRPPPTGVLNTKPNGNCSPSLERLSPPQSLRSSQWRTSHVCRGMLSLRTSKMLCSKSGYDDHYTVVRCAEYGVPQSRRRLVLLASKPGPIQMIPPTSSQEGLCNRQRCDPKSASLMRQGMPLHRIRCTRQAAFPQRIWPVIRHYNACRNVARLE